MPDAPVPHIYDVPFPKTHLLYFDVYRDKLCQLILQYFRQVDRAPGEPDDVPGKHAFVLGIHGPWGSGKSTLMRMLGREVEQRLPGGDAGGVLRVKFQAWKYNQREVLWRALLSRVVGVVEEGLRARLPGAVGDAEAIRGFDERRRAGDPPESGAPGDLARLLGICEAIQDSLYRDYEVSRGATLAPAPSLVVEAGPGRLAGELEELRRTRAREYHDRIRDIDRLQELFRELREGSGCKWMIEIDDLDRCLPEGAIEVFEATKVFLDVSGVVFLLALDRETIRRGLEMRYLERAGDRPLVDPDLYVEKVTNLSFVLPNLSDPANVKELIRDADESRMDGFGDERQRESIEKLMIELLEHQDRHVQPNPRRWIRLLNTALLYNRMRKPLEIELLKHGFTRMLLRNGFTEAEAEEQVRGLPELVSGKREKGRRKGKEGPEQFEKLSQEQRYRLWTVLHSVRGREDWERYSTGQTSLPAVSAWRPEDADRTFLKVLCLSYRWGGFMQAALNSWEVMVTFEQAASQSERSFERFREICTARYPGLRAFAEDPDLFQVLLSKPRIAHPRPPDFILEMF